MKVGEEAKAADWFDQRVAELDKHTIAAETLEALGWTWDGQCWTESAVQTNSESALATQVGGDHYKSLPIQPVEYCHRNGLGFCESSVVKYVSRWKAKNGIKDLEKAKHFIELLIQLETEK